MASDRFAVTLTDQAKKDIRAHPAHKERITLELDKLSLNPELGNVLSGTLQSCRTLSFTVKGSGAFRAIYYVVPDEQTCIVFIVGPHEGVYAKAERRARSLL